MTNGTQIGSKIDTSCAVFIAYMQNDRDVELTTDDWGDRAVVVDVHHCIEHTGCRILTVAPDESDTLENVHANTATNYAVDA